MIKITFPKRNRLLQKVFNTIEVHEKQDVDLLTHRADVLDIILENLGLDPQNEIEITVAPQYTNGGQESKVQDGQFITIEYNVSGTSCIHYVFFSYEYPQDTRNGYIIAKLPISYRTFYNDVVHGIKSFNIFLLCVEHTNDISMTDENVYLDSVTNFTGVSAAVNGYQTFVYKICRTLDINIINYNQLDWSLNRANEIEAQTPFTSVKKMKDFRNKMVRAHNKSSYIIENANDTILYGKTFGNNGFEIILMAAAAKAITKGNVYLWQIKDTKRLVGEDRKAAPITSDNLNLLNKLGIESYDELKEYTPNEEALREGDVRNQAEFIKNLMIKFESDEKKCYLCSCNIQKLIIASHIHRVCDINKESIPFDQKREKAVSGDNGLWLCANHDKLFEHGLIYFDDNGDLHKSDLIELTDEQKKYIEQITVDENGVQCTCIEPRYLTENMKGYLSMHRHRTHPELE